MEWGNEILFKRSGSHDQDGRHAHTHVWELPLKLVFSETERHIILKIGIQHGVLKYYPICSIDDSTFTARSYLFPKAFVWEKA